MNCGKGKIEILAPAGGREQLEAAVRSGADAVYLGLTGFNARQNAQNFDNADEVVSYCHSRGVKIHFTVNTLVNDEEIPELYKTLKAVAESGADGIIVQDLAAVKIVRECCPALPLHASTQMTVHNLAGVRQLEQLGFKRAVLSRELSLDEIRNISENTSMEIEVFVHGALCMCMSGACYLSSMLGGRSGNRGFCAQPCRLDFKLNGNSYALSLKDMCHIPYIDELAAAGVCSLKIEGRMKRPEYVAAAVDACRKKLSGEEPDIEILSSVFSRSGFTDGYLTSRINHDMFGYRTKENVVAANSVLKGLQQLYKDERKSLCVDMAVTVEAGKPCALHAKCGDFSASAEGAVAAPAQNRPLDEETLKKQLSKTGGTPFSVGKFSAVCGENLNLPLPELNRLRRTVLDELSAKLGEIRPFEFIDRDYSQNPHKKSANKKPELFVRCEKPEQLNNIKNAAGYIIPANEIIKNPALIKRFGDRIIAALPQIFFSDKAAEKTLESLKKLGVGKALADNIGAVFLCRKYGLEIMGGHGLNILNSLALAEYEKAGVEKAVLSFELSAQRIADISANIPAGIIAYGHLPLMQLRSCPARGTNGCGGCNGNPVITDRMGNDFRIVCNERKFSTLLNPVVLDLRGKPVGNVDFYLLWFTQESAEMCGEIYSAYRSESFPVKNPDGKYTRGLYFREIQ